MMNDYEYKKMYEFINVGDIILYCHDVGYEEKKLYQVETIGYDGNCFFAYPIDKYLQKDGDSILIRNLQPGRTDKNYLSFIFRDRNPADFDTLFCKYPIIDKEIYTDQSKTIEYLNKELKTANNRIFELERELKKTKDFCNDQYIKTRSKK